MQKHGKNIVILIILSYIFLIFGNSIMSLTNPDEVFYTLTAKEMEQNKSWMTPYMFGEPQFEKPIFLYWMMRISLNVFGNENFAARFPAALFGLLGVIAVYLLGVIGFKDDKKAFIASLVIMSGGLYIGLSRTVFTDMIFSIFILFSFLFFYWGYERPKNKGAGIILFFVSCAFAVLTKGPLGFLIPFISITVFLLIKKDLKFLFNKSTFTGFLLFILISFPWYILMIKMYGSSFTYEFFYNDHYRRLIEAEHLMNDTWYFYPMSMVGCMFPWSLFVFFSLIDLFRNIKKKLNNFNLFLLCWIVMTFLIFQPAHSKLVSYIFPLFPALALVCGGFVYESVFLKKRMRLSALLFSITLVFSSIIALGILFAKPFYKQYISSINQVYIFASFFICFVVLLWIFMLRRDYVKVTYSIIFLVPVMLFGAIFFHKDMEPFVSSKQVSEYILKNYDIEGPILCSKFFVRGTRFYTGKEVAVIDIPGKKFFSPHPVEFLDEDYKVYDFVNKHKTVYCVLKRANVEDIKRISELGFKYNILKKIGNIYLVRIESSG